MRGILCFGDSIVFGSGELPCKGWVGRLKEEFETKEHNFVFNLGFPGHTSTDLLKRIETEAKTRIRFSWPDEKYLLIISIGMNDCKWRLKNGNKQVTLKKQFKENIEKLIKITKKFKAEAIFIGLTPIDEKAASRYEDTGFSNKRIGEYNEIIKKTCKDTSFLDMFNIMSKKKYEILLEDGLHPNTKGYDLMYKEIKKYIQEKAAI